MQLQDEDKPRLTNDAFPFTSFREEADSVYYESDVNEVWAAFMAHQQQNNDQCKAYLMNELKTQLSKPYFCMLHLPIICQ